MIWLNLILMILQLVNRLMEYGQEQKWIGEGEDRQIAKALAEQLRKTNYAKQALQEARLMSDAELAQRLRDLEPGETDSK